MPGNAGDQNWGGMTYDPVQGPDGKRYMVVTAGGFGIGDLSPAADYVVAFTL